jgi:signal transduction histidine kinase
MSRIENGWGYAFAVASVALALLVTRWLGPERAGVAPLFFAAVATSTWLGGLGAGLAATVLSAVATAYFLLEPVHSFSTLVDDAVRLVVFVGVAVLISYLHDAAERARVRAEDAQRQAEAARREAEEARSAADDANRSKDRFLAAVSHDLRSPLSAILLWATMLQGRGGDDPTLRAEGLGAIRQSAEAQARLVEDLVDTARIAAGKIRVEPRRIDLAELVRSTVIALRPVAERAGQRLEAELPPGPVEVLADPDRTRQVLGNLLANAVKFSDAGGRVRVALERAGDAGGGAVAQVSVSDEGRGIEPAFLPRVFERFSQQADGSRENLGLGLGLSIARHLVERQGGRIAASSEGAGRGATFTFTLPASAATPAPPSVARKVEPGLVAS